MKDDQIYPIWECSKCGRREFQTLKQAKECCGYYAFIYEWMIHGINIGFSTKYDAITFLEGRIEI
jgi:hypothetical protein